MTHTNTCTNNGTSFSLIKTFGYFYMGRLDFFLYEQNKLFFMSHWDSGLLLGAAGFFPNMQWCCYGVEGHNYEVV